MKSLLSAKVISRIFFIISVIFLIGSFFPFPIVLADSQGAKFASTATSSDWLNPENTISAENDSCASTKGANKDITLTNFVFSVPSNAVINGIMVEAKIGRSNITGARNFKYKIVKSGVATGNEKEVGVSNGVPIASQCSETSFVSAGGSTDLWGISTLTPSDINGSGFGIIVNGSGGSSTKFLDAVKITVYYSPTNLTVVKNTVGGNGAFDIVGDNGIGNFSITTSVNTGSQTFNNLAPGSYAITETVPNGWNKTNDTCLTVTVTAGQTSTCTITNTKLPTLTLVKTVINDNGGTKQISDFVLKIDGNQVTNNTSSIVSVGSHTASEVSLSGYSASSWGGDCNADGTITLSAGDNKTCTITNDDLAPSLTINKVLLPSNDNGKFNLQIDGSTVGTGANVGNNGTTGAVITTAGNHTVGETAGTGIPLSHYTSAISGDCASDGTITLSVGDNKTCTITNTKKPSLTLVTTVINDNGGTRAGSDFVLKIDGNQVTGGETNLLEVGQHTASQVNLSGYSDSSWGGNCATDGTITLAAGDIKTCTITNDDVAGSFVRSGSSGGGGGSSSDPIPIFLLQPTLLISEESVKIPIITEDVVVITWVTNVPGSSYVIYSREGEPHSLNYSDNNGLPPKYGYTYASNEKDIDQKVTFHSVIISGLNPNTNYHFRTVSRGSLAISEEYKLITDDSLKSQANLEENYNSNNISVENTDTIALDLEILDNSEFEEVESTPRVLFDASISPVFEKSNNISKILLLIFSLILLSFIAYKIYKKMN